MSKAYRSGFGDVARVADRVQALVGQGLDVVEAYAAARAASSSRELVRIEKARARAALAHQQAVAHHGSRVTRLQRNAVTLFAASGAAGLLGVIDVAAGGEALPGAPGWWLGGAAVAAVLGVRSRWSAEHATPPAETPFVATSIALDARALRREAVGWSEAQGLVAVRRQVITMVPAVAALHPDAGRELAGAEAEAGPVLAAQITRLVLLDQVAHDLPGTSAAAAAGSSAERVRQRLADGVTRYDTLLAAASRLLAAPDLSRSTADILGPAADALTAYAHGLAVASPE
ncbi:MAG: hypothetical protein ABI468_10735 [Candidatus Nanopelagicales bacterium]